MKTCFNPKLPVALPCLLMMALSGVLHAEDKPNGEPPAMHAVFVPYDETKPPQGQTAQRYFLNRTDFERLWTLAKENRKPAPLGSPDGDKVEAHLLSALYDARIEEQSLHIEARYLVATRGAWASTDIALRDAASNNAVVPITEVLLDGKPAALEGGKLRMETPGMHQLTVRFAQPRVKGWTATALVLPQAAASSVRLAYPESDGTPEFTDTSLLISEQSPVLTVALGTVTKLEFKRTAKRPLVSTPPPSAVLDTNVEINDDRRVTATVMVSYNFPGASRRELALTLDPDWDVKDVFLWSTDWRKDIRLTRTEADGRHTLRLTTIRDLRDSARITLILHPHNSNPKRTPVIVPVAGKHEVTAALASTSGITVAPAPASTQGRLANKPWTISQADDVVVKVDALTFRVRPGESLAFDAQLIAARTEARTDYVVQLSEQKQEVFAAIALKRQHGRWQQLRVQLPAPGFEVQAITGTHLATWDQVGDQVFVRFTAAAAAETRIVVYAATTRAQALSDWTLMPMKLDGIEKLTGTATIAAHSATEVKLGAAVINAREIDSATLDTVFTITPPIAKQRAVQFDRFDWSVTVSLHEHPVRFSADGVLLAQATETGLLVSQQIALGVEQGALKHVVIRLPKALPEATVQGALLREVKLSIVGEFREYDCTFQSQGGLQGHTSLTLEMQIPLSDAEFAIPFVEIPEASRLRRWFVLDNASARELTLTKSDGVEPTTKDALPYLPQILAQPRYYTARTSGGLGVVFKQLQTSAGNAAFITLADISTVLRSDGERWDTLVYAVQNRALQFLPVILPDGAELIAVSVSGEAVRADEALREGRRVRLIPMIQTRPGQTSMEVRLVYRIKGDVITGAERFDDPEVPGISAERTIWTVTLPKGWRVDERFKTLFGNMEMISAEGHGVERLNKMLSDYQTINRYLGSGASNISEADNLRVVDEAKKLGKEIGDLHQLVLTENRIQQPVFSERQLPQQEDWKQRVDVELSHVSRELQRQSELLTGNEARQKRRGKGTMDVNGMNSWVPNGGTLNAMKAKAQTGNALVGYNDNVGVNAVFFGQVGNDFGRTTVVSDSVDGVLKRKVESAPQLALNNSRAFNTDGNIQINGGVLDIADFQTGTAAGRKVKAEESVKELEDLSRLSKERKGFVTLSRAPVDPLAPATPEVEFRSSGVAGTGTLTKEGAGTLTLSGTVTYNGGTSVGGGTLTATSTIGGIIAGTGGVAKKGDVALSITSGGIVASSGPPSVAAKSDAPAARAEKTVHQSIEGKDVTAGWASQPGAIHAYDNYTGDKVITTQLVNQLRPTGRRSLSVQVPAAGEVFHFRKLRDHAVLDLQLKRDWPPAKTSQATVFGVGLGLWALLAVLVSRRKK